MPIVVVVRLLCRIGRNLLRPAPAPKPEGEDHGGNYSGGNNAYHYSGNGSIGKATLVRR